MNIRQRTYLTERVNEIVGPAIGYVPPHLKRIVKPYTIKELYDEILAGKHPIIPGREDHDLKGYYKNILEYLKFNREKPEDGSDSPYVRYHNAGEEVYDYDTKEMDAKWRCRAAAVKDFCMLGSLEQAITLIHQLIAEVDEFLQRVSDASSEALKTRIHEGVVRRAGTDALKLTWEDKRNGR